MELEPRAAEVGGFCGIDLYTLLAAPRIKRGAANSVRAKGRRYSSDTARSRWCVGKVIVKVAPWPGALATVNVPP